MLAHSVSGSTLRLEDLAMLQDIFDDLCRQRGLEKNTPAASNLAADLIDLFQLGVQDARELETILSSRKPSR